MRPAEVTLDDLTPADLPPAELAPERTRFTQAGDAARMAQVAVWSGVIAIGARRGGWLGTVALAYGVERLTRLTLGRSLWQPLWQRLRATVSAIGLPTADKTQHFGDGTRDLVDEASWESFPASDPPGRGIA